MQHISGTGLAKHPPASKLLGDLLLGSFGRYGSDGYPDGDATRNTLINVYSSVDLVRWQNHGTAFTMPAATSAGAPLRCAPPSPSGVNITCYADRCHVSCCFVLLSPYLLPRCICAPSPRIHPLRSIRQVLQHPKTGVDQEHADLALPAGGNSCLTLLFAAMPPCAVGLFIMWCKSKPFASVAVSKTPIGPFKLTNLILPGNHEVGDCTVFADPVGNPLVWPCAARI